MRGSGTVTILFTDLVGSTELAGRLGDDAADELRREHFAVLREAIAAHGGDEVKNVGDGLMVAFGSTADAAAAAIAMQQSTAKLSHRRSETPLAIRVGISVGEATHEDGDWFGTPVVEAARLCAAANGGQVLASELVRALAGTRGAFQFVDRGRLELKGLHEPVATVEVAWDPPPLASVPLPSLLERTEQFSFVGREDEFETLERAWKGARAGEPRTVLIAGEPGVGKTRLAAELGRRSHDTGATVLFGRCDDELGVPYQPFVECLRHQVGHTPPGELLDSLGRLGGELSRLVPELAAAVPGLPAPLASDPETERYRLFDAVALWLSASAEPDGLVIVLDDLHWAAKPTLLLMRHVIRSPQLGRVMVVGTYRDTDLDRNHPLAEMLADLRRTTNVDRLALSGLDRAGVAAFVERAAGHELDEAGEALVDVLYRETDGNPFFVGEVIRHLAESGAIYQRDGRWVSDLAAEELGIPEGVREVIGRRLGLLSDAANQVLTRAAVIGVEFSVSVLQRVADLDDDVLMDAIEEASRARLIEEVQGSSLPYRFSHALVRSTLYEEISLIRRVQLHRRVGEVMEVMYQGRLDGHLPELAYHFTQAAAGGDAATALEYTRRAGDGALDQYAHDEAIRYYRQALDLLDATAPDDDDARCDVLVRLGEAQRRAGDAAHRETLLEAARLAQRLRDPDRLAAAALANHRGFWALAGEVDAERVAALDAAIEAVGEDRPSLRARLLSVLAQELVFGGDLDRRRALADQAVALARQTGDAVTLAEALFGWILSNWVPMTRDDRAAYATELHSLRDAVPHGMAKMWALLTPGLSAIECGDLASSDAHFRTAAVESAELGQPAIEWVVAYMTAARDVLRGELDTAEPMITRALELAEASDQPDGLMFYASQQFALRFEQGRLAEVVDLVAQFVRDSPGLPAWETALALAYCELDRHDEARAVFAPMAARGFELPQDIVWLQGQCMTAAACAELGDADSAAALYALLEPYADHVAGIALIWFGAVAHFLGLLATTMGRWDDAAQQFAAAATMHEEMGAPAWLARTRMEWARMLLRRGADGDAARARELLEQARSAGTELGLGNVERRAAAALTSYRG